MKKLAYPVASLLFIIGFFAYSLANLRFADPLPFSDESAHLNKVLNLEINLGMVRSTLGWWHTHLFSSDPYPHVMHMVAYAFLSQGHTIEVVRQSMLIFPLLHLIIAFAVGPRIFGITGTFAYGFLVAFNPILLAYFRMFMVDVPLVSMVGAAFLLTLASDGFRRVAPAMGLAVVATLGMLTKWVWAVFLVIPIAISTAWAAWHSSERWWGRGLWLLVLAGFSVGGTWKIWQAGSSVTTLTWQQTGVAAWTPVYLVVGSGVVIGGWGILSLVASRYFQRPLPAGVHVLGMVGGVLLGAGPWYVLMMQKLFDRLTLEKDQFDVRSGKAAWEESAAVLEWLVPAYPIWGALGLVGVLVGLYRTRSWGPVRVVLSGLSGAGLGFYVIVKTLPFDPRYLLPVLPMLAAVVVAGWEGLGRSGWLATGALGALMLGLGVAPLWDVTAVGRLGSMGMAVNVQTWQGLKLPSIARTHPRIGKKAAVEALTARVGELCGHRPCRVGFVSHPELVLQGRGLAALVGFSGTYLEVVERDTPGMTVLVGSCIQRPSQVSIVGCELTEPISAGCSVYLCSR